MEDLTLYNTRITFLWLLAILAFFGYINLATSEVPSNFSNLSLVTDQDVAIVSIILMALAFLSLILKGSTNRSTNIIGGSVVGIGFLATFVDGVTVNLNGIYNIMMAAGTIFIVLIVWFAYKMPKQKA